MFDVDAARSARGQRPVDVELISMPWTSLTEPSLGLGILHSVLAEGGLAGRVRHLNLLMLRFLRPGTYRALAEAFALNDFLFSGVLDPVITTRQWGWLRAKVRGLVASGSLRRGGTESVTEDQVTEQLVDLRTRVLPSWLGGQADSLARSPAPLIGFTCMFDQTIASVALAHLVKLRDPGKLIALGGYAVRDPTATTMLNAFDWIDVVCPGEGEPSIVPLAHAAAGRLPLADVPGIIYRDATRGHLRRTAAAAPVDLARGPTPGYDDFFIDVADLSEHDQIDIPVVRLPVENSRGCWWGQIRHCVFCGIHDDDLRYRTKPADVALHTMDELAHRYGVRAFRFSDYILPRAYFATLLPALAARGAPYALTAEMKANIHPDGFALLAAAGFVEVQPGIESFSARALKTMDKGTSPAQNAQTLILGRKCRVRVNWNLLYGFPDDDADDLEQMLETLSRLTHLDPPATTVPVQVTRYAPLQVDPARFGISPATYEPSYELVFSAAYREARGFDLGAYCYFFARPFTNSLRLTGLHRRIDALVDLWRAAARQQRRPALIWKEKDGAVTVIDSRWPGSGEPTELSRAAGVCLLALERPRSRNGLRRLDIGLNGREIDDALAELDRFRLVLRDGDRWLSVTLPAEPPAGDVTEMREPSELAERDCRHLCGQSGATGSPSVPGDAAVR